jgi:hypothetical protein
VSARLSPQRETEITEEQARQRVADQILPIVFATNVSRAACLTEPPEAIPLLTARRIASNVKKWVLTGDWQDRALTDLEFENVSRASVPALLAELVTARAERDEARAQLAKYVGHEPTSAEEMAYLSRCLDAVRDLCDDAEKQAKRWETPLPVPEWVDQVRAAAEGGAR